MSCIDEGNGNRSIFLNAARDETRKNAGHTKTPDDEKRSVRADPTSGCRSAASFPLPGRNEEFAILVIVGNDFPARQMDGIKLISRVPGEIRHVEPCTLKSYNTSPPE